MSREISKLSDEAFAALDLLQAKIDALALNGYYVRVLTSSDREDPYADHKHGYTPSLSLTFGRSAEKV